MERRLPAVGDDKDGVAPYAPTDTLLTIFSRFMIPVFQSTYLYRPDHPSLGCPDKLTTLTVSY
jgi:hypothetical protein